VRAFVDGHAILRVHERAQRHIRIAMDRNAQRASQLLAALAV